MEHLDNFKILSGIQNSTVLLIIKYILIPVQHLKAVKCMVAFILYVSLDIEMQIICPGEYFLLYHVQK